MRHLISHLDVVRKSAYGSDRDCSRMTGKPEAIGSSFGLVPLNALLFTNEEVPGWSANRELCVCDLTSRLRRILTLACTFDAAKLHPRAGFAAAWVLPEGSWCASRRRKIRGPLPFPSSVGSAESVGRG
jgi:hypothetical protein